MTQIRALASPRNALSVLLFIGGFNFTTALSAQELWFASGAGGSGSDSGNGIALDGTGSIYIVGHFEGDAVFGEGEINETTIESDGLLDFYVAKYSSDGALDWAFRDGDTHTEQAFDVAVDRDGFVYIAGLFADSAYFGRGQPGETLLIADNVAHNGFVAKYSPDGLLQWAKWAGNNQARSVELDESGNVYVAGFYGGSVTFGAGEPNEQTLPGDAESNDGFLARFSGDGIFAWATGVNGTGFDAITDVALDSSKNLYVTGFYEDGAVIGAGDPTEEQLESNGETDGFVAQYDSTGSLVWIQSFGGPGRDSGNAIASADTGVIAVVGDFQDAVVFGSNGPNETVLTSVGGDDIFIASMESDGGLRWAKRAGGDGDDVATAVDMTPGYQVITTGGFEGTATFGEDESGEVTFTSFGDNDIFVAEIDSTGLLSWVTQSGSLTSREFGEFGLGVTFDSLGNGYVAGVFEGSATFGRNTPEAMVLVSNGASDSFVVRFGDAIVISIDPLAKIGNGLEISNYPNPFSSSTTFRYRVGSPSNVRIGVYDIIGRRVADVVDRHHGQGWHEVGFNASRLVPGVYFARIETLFETRSSAVVVTRFN